MLLPHGVKRKSDNSFRRGLGRTEEARSASGLEIISKLKSRDLGENPKQMARRLESHVHFDDGEILFAHPDFSGEQAEETFFARTHRLVWFRLEGDNMAGVAVCSFVRQPFPSVALPEIISPDRFGRGFRLVLFLAFLS